MGLHAHSQLFMSLSAPTTHSLDCNLFCTPMEVVALGSIYQNQVSDDCCKMLHKLSMDEFEHGWCRMADIWTKDWCGS